jgi:cysteine desulfurase family protein
MKNLIYLDNAATSFPKPPRVTEAMSHFMTEVGANPGRSGHALAREAGRIVQETRERLAILFNIPATERIVFTSNITESINTVIHGFLNDGDHVIITAMEHNAVSRPLKYLEKKGVINLDIAPCNHQGILDPDALGKMLRTTTALVVINHASNVCGTLQDIRGVKNIIGDIPLLVDTAQTAGCYPIDVVRDGIDFLAFTGHKGLMGPQGTGGLYLREGLALRPLKRGGTGSISESLEQPDFLPDALESGTQNNVGIAGLGAGAGFILETGVETIMEHERGLTNQLLSGLRNLSGVTVYGPLNAEKQTATVSLTFDSLLPGGEEQTLGGCGAINLAWMEGGPTPSEVGVRLNEDFDILVRVGIHCAPLAHRTLGTYPDGTIRLSMGYFNTPGEVETAVQAIKKVAESPGKSL